MASAEGHLLGVFTYSRVLIKISLPVQFGFTLHFAYNIIKTLCQKLIGLCQIAFDTMPKFFWLRAKNFLA
jgi:hypothetical protein